MGSESDLPVYEIPDQFADLDDDRRAPILVREWKRLIHDANWWMQNAVGHKADADASRARRDFARAEQSRIEDEVSAAQTAVGFARLHLLKGDVEQAKAALDKYAARNDPEGERLG